MTREARNDLFQTTFIELHQEAPTELIKSFRECLEHIRANNPQSAQTAEACLQGLAPDNSTLLHVLTAAYLINGGVMLKHHAYPHEREEAEEADIGADRERDFDFRELEAELASFSEPLEPIRAPEVTVTVPKPFRKNLLSTD
jgi:hypothetical protein